MEAIDFQNLVLSAEEQITELSNTLFELSAYEKRGKLNMKAIKEDEDFGTFDNLNNLYKQAKSLIETIKEFEDNL